MKTMAKILGKDPFTYQKERDSFLQDLQRFHIGRGTAYRSIPTIFGKQVDLFLLYSTVTRLGGWMKVNDEPRWEEVQEYFNIPLACTNSALALKHIYVRYLSHYEKLHFFGEDPDRVTDDQGDDKSSHHHHHQGRKKTTGPQWGVPLTYNHGQHNITDAMRSTLGLQKVQETTAQGDYHNLEMALVSGLPNEVDFALNVCTLLSNEGRHTLKLTRCPRILRLMLAHIGIFEEDAESMYNLHINGWKKYSNRNFLKFWRQSICDKRIRKLYLSAGSLDGNDTDCAWFPVEEADWSLSSSEEDDRVDEESVLNLDEDMGIYNVEGQRVIQLAMILRNLSFEEENMKVIAKNVGVYRFLMLCVHSKYNNLKQLALDTLSNIALQMVLAPIRSPTTRLVLETIASCIASPDKFQVVSGLDILLRLCQVERNEEVICDHLAESVYRDIIQLLTVHDIQLIVYTLEALYQLSELGEVTTTHIAAVRMAVETLVNLVTVEAQSYGPQSLIGIKVVEHVTTVAVSETKEPSSQNSIQQQMAAPQPTPAMPSHDKKVVASTPTRNTPQKASLKRPQAMPTPPPRPAIAATPPPANLPSAAALTHAANQAMTQVTQPLLKTAVELDSDTLACNWLQTHYDFMGVSATPGPPVSDGMAKMELYGEFLTTCGRLGIKNITSAANFTNCVRITFPKVDSVKVVKPDGAMEQFYRGLRKKAVPMQFPPNIDSSVPGMRPPSRTPTPNSPMLALSPPPQAVGSPTAPYKAAPRPPNSLQLPTPPASPTKTSYPTIQQALMGQTREMTAPRPPTPQSPQLVANPAPSAAQPATNTTLIKSLLANKVAQNMNRQLQMTQEGVTSPTTPTKPFQSYHTLSPNQPLLPPPLPPVEPVTPSSKAKKKKNSPPSTPTSKTKPKRSPRPKSAKGQATVITDSKALDDVIDSVARQGSLDEDSNQGDSPMDTTDSKISFGGELIAMEGVECLDSVSSKTVCVNGTNGEESSLNGPDTHNKNGDTVSEDNKIPTNVTTAEKIKSQMLNMNGTVHHVGNGECTKPSNNGSSKSICDPTDSSLSARKGLLMAPELKNNPGENSVDSGIKCDEPEKESAIVENGFSTASKESFQIPQLDGAHDPEGEAEAMDTSTSVTQTVQAAPAVSQTVTAQPQVPVQMVYSQVPQQSVAYTMNPASTTQYQMISMPGSVTPMMVPTQAVGSSVAQPQMVVQGAPQKVQQIAAPQAVQQVVPGAPQAVQQVVQGAPQAVQQVIQGAPQAVQQVVSGAPIQQVVAGVQQVVSGTPQAMPTPVVPGAAAAVPGATPAVAAQGVVPAVAGQPGMVVQAPVHLQQTQQQLQIQQQQLQMQLQQLQQMQQHIQQQQWMISQQQSQPASGAATTTVTTPAASQPFILPKSTPAVTTTTSSTDQPAQSSVSPGIQPQVSPGSGPQPYILPKPQQQVVMQPQQGQATVQPKPVSTTTTVSQSQPAASTATTQSAPSPGPQTISMPASRFVVPQIRPPASIGQPQLVHPGTAQYVAQQIVRPGQMVPAGTQVLHGQPQVRPQYLTSQSGQTILQQQIVPGQNVVQHVLQPGQKILQQLKPGQQYVQTQYIQAVPGQPQQVGQPQVIRHQVVLGQPQMQGQPQVVQGQSQVVQGQTQAVQGQTPMLQGQPQGVQGQPLQGQPQVAQVAQSQTQVTQGQPQAVQGQLQPVQSQPQAVQSQSQTQVTQVQPKVAPQGQPQLAQQAQAQPQPAAAQPQPVQAQLQGAQYGHLDVFQGSFVTAKGQVVQTSQLVQPGSAQAQLLQQQVVLNAGKVTVMIGGQTQILQYQPPGQRPAVATTITAPTIQIPPPTKPQPTSATPSPISTPPPASPHSKPSPTGSSTSTAASATKNKRPARTPSADKKSKKKAKTRSNSTDSRPPSNPSSGQPSPAPSTAAASTSTQYICDWNNCKCGFDTAKAINRHVIKEHFEKPPAVTCCMWEGCERVRRQKWSLMTHLQDRHLNEPSLKAALTKRQQGGSTSAPPAPAAPAPPPPPPPPPALTNQTQSSSSSAANQNLYPNDAAMQAIRRFAARPPFPEITEPKEGPVTKHIRLTAALILRNLARYSSLGRSQLKKHEQHLASAALSATEASGPLATCLWELHQQIPSH